MPEPQSMITFKNAITDGSKIVGEFVQRFYKLRWAANNKLTVTPSELGLSDLFMIKGYEAGIAAQPQLSIRMVNADGFPSPGTGYLN
jgi:hypothetical protein